MKKRDLFAELMQGVWHIKGAESAGWGRTGKSEKPSSRPER